MPMQPTNRPADTPSLASPRGEFLDDSGEYYAQLKAIARSLLSHERKGHTLQATALVHEAYLRLKVGAQDNWPRSQAIPVAVKAMRHVLVDHARARAAQKRDGRVSSTGLDEQIATLERSGVQVLEIEDGLAHLAQIDVELGKIVEWKFFGGLSNQEIADTLEVPLRRVERGWQTARAYLKSLLQP